VGLEPNPFAADAARTKGVTVLGEMLGRNICIEAVRRFGQFDVVTARQVLEHLLDIDEFFLCVDILLKPEGLLFIDVPDVEVAIRTGDCSFIWEEHVNYFHEAILRNMISAAGYAPVRLERFNFSGGTLAIAAKRGEASEQGRCPGLIEAALEFPAKVSTYGRGLSSVLGRYRSLGFATAMYGVGCRACTLVNGLELRCGLDFAIDDQPERQGLFMPGSKLPIHPLGVLSERLKNLVLLAVNQENEAQVTERLAGLDGVHHISVLSPTDINHELGRAAVEANTLERATL
jgi:hypothetical protein